MVHYVHNYHNLFAMIFFFAFLFLSFLMPHDQELYLEFYWAAVLLILLGYRIFIQQKALVLPRTLLLLWGTTLLGLIITAAASRSIASSLAVFVRYFEGAIIFFLALDNRAHHHTTPTVTKALLATGKATILTFFLLICFPFVSQVIPPYNGILAANGHHPIAHFLVALVPVITLLSLPRGAKRYIHYFLVFLALILSAARGAWIVVAAFLTFRSTQIKTISHQFFTFTVIGLFITAFSGMFWLSLLPYEQKLNVAETYPPLGMFVKESNHTLRFGYIQEAVHALRDKPLLGHGPGTFHLLSRLYAASPASYARFTHSLPFEILAENGFAGTIPIAVLFGTVFLSLLSIIRISTNTPRAALAWSALLLLYYSVIETTLNNLSIWLLFWAISGHVVPYVARVNQRLSETVSFIMLFALIAFIASYGVTRVFSPKLTLTQSVAIAPYFKSNILQEITTAGTQEVKRNAPNILAWHSKDPDMYQALARTANPFVAEKYYMKALDYDPHNNGYLKEYLALLIDNDKSNQVGATMCRFSQSDPRMKSNTLCGYLRGELFTRYSNTGSFYSALNYLQGTDGKAKFYYFLGLSVFHTQQDIDGATLLWQTARDIAPEWGFYHLELASAYYYWHKNEEMADAALLACTQNAYAKSGCRKAVSDLTDLLEPGLRAPDIIAIPAILPQ